jgi:hypothetical protein
MAAKRRDVASRLRAFADDCSVDIIERIGGHLDIVNDGEAIALILLDLARPSQWLTPTCHPSIADTPIWSAWVCIDAVVPSRRSVLG